MHIQTTVQILISLSDSALQMIVVIDNTTKTKQFLPKILAYLGSKKTKYTVVRTLEELQEIPKTMIHAYILSGSSSNLHDMTISQYLMNVAAIHHGVPVLGICFGAQFLQVYYGGQLCRLSRLYCQDLDIMLANNQHHMSVRFCNHYAMEHVATTLQALATYTVENKPLICMFRHKTKPHYGMLFHPEHHLSTHVFLDAFLRLSKLEINIKRNSDLL